jgi:hypothetical protein
MEDRDMADQEEARRLRVGWWVFGALAVLTGIEFWLSTAVRSALPYLVLTATIKAGLIMIYFMHVRQIWGARKVEEV